MMRHGEQIQSRMPPTRPTKPYRSHARTKCAITTGANFKNHEAYVHIAASALSAGENKGVFRAPEFGKVDHADKKSSLCERRWFVGDRGVGLGLWAIEFDGWLKMLHGLS
ncbi:hypothetical protein HGRIS_008648 [Hohenbuehelia grisea]|uniref:Uncharacterized protein n=1 Tax=Hohenbuehelia grisea TaxID=104357 RepID=A0ABR3J8M8_9AGAR